MSYWLFLEDVRELGTYPCKYSFLDHKNVKIARSSKEAIEIVREFGLPDFMALDHDLGGTDTTMVFLYTLSDFFLFSEVEPPHFAVHSANPIGSLNIQAFMKSWRDVYNPE